MKLFKEELESRQARNRNQRFGGWKGLIIKILLLLTVIYFTVNFNSNSASNILWFISGGKTSAHNSSK